VNVSVIELATYNAEAIPVSSWIVAGDGTKATILQGHYSRYEPSRGYAAGYIVLAGFEGSIASFPTNHFLVLVKGEIGLTFGDEQVDVRAGNAAIVPRGTACHWRNTEGAELYFMNLDGALGTGQPKPVLIDAAAHVEPIGGPPVHLITSSPPPVVGRNIQFQDSTNHFVAGIWEASPYARNAAGFAHDELMYLIEGTVMFTDQSGHTFSFGPGDVFMIPRETPCAWSSPIRLRKIFCNLYPSPQ